MCCHSLSGVERVFIWSATGHCHSSKVDQEIVVGVRILVALSQDCGEAYELKEAKASGYGLRTVSSR